MDYHVHIIELLVSFMNSKMNWEFAWWTPSDINAGKIQALWEEEGHELPPALAG